jgi:hypothetical protein
MNEMQKRILQQKAPRIDTRPRSAFLCRSWSADNQSGVITDETGFCYNVTADDLDPTCEGFLLPGERISGIVDSMSVGAIIVESGDRAIGDIKERPGFESVGPAPEVRGWDPHRGTPGIGHIRLGK